MKIKKGFLNLIAALVLVSSAAWAAGVTLPTLQAAGTLAGTDLAWCRVAASATPTSDSKCLLSALKTFMSDTPALVTPALGTPSSGTLTNTTGFPTANLAGLGTGVATFLATPSSANLAAAVTGETGTGAAVFATSPALVTPALGVATATSINGGTLTGNNSGDQPMSGNVPFAYLSGKWYTTSRTSGTTTGSYSNTGSGTIMFCTPFTIGPGGVTITDIGGVWITNTGSTAAWFHVYRDNVGALGTKMAAIQVTGISTSIIAATLISNTLSPAVALTEGHYWGCTLPNSGGVTSLQALATGAHGGVLGYADPTQPDTAGTSLNGRLEVTGLTYGEQATNLGAMTRNNSSTGFATFWFKAQ